MPTYDYSCEKHGIFEISCRLAEWDDHKPCPKCKKSSEQILLPNTVRDAAFQPIVVHVDAQDNVSFPGRADARPPAGFQKKELRTIRDIERFERQMNVKLQGEAREHQEREEKHFSEQRSRLRSELRQRMQSMSSRGRDFAQFVMDLNNQRRRKPTDPGFHLEILHLDQSSRRPYRDQDTGWKEKRV